MLMLTPTIETSHVGSIQSALQSEFPSLTLTVQSNGVLDATISNLDWLTLDTETREFMFDLFGRHEIGLSLGAGWPRLWELLGFVLPRRTREKLFAPSFADLIKDYMSMRHARYQTTGCGAWLTFCFTIRTVEVILQCHRCCAEERSRWHAAVPTTSRRARIELGIGGAVCFEIS